MGARGRGENSVLPDNELLHAVCRADLEDGLHGILHEVAAVAANYERVRHPVERIEDRLNEILGVVLFGARQHALYIQRSRRAHLLLEDLHPAANEHAHSSTIPASVLLTVCGDQTCPASGRQMAWWIFL